MIVYMSKWGAEISLVQSTSEIKVKVKIYPCVKHEYYVV